MKKILKYALRLNNLSKALNFNTIWSSIVDNIETAIINNPLELVNNTKKNINIFVLSPHPDDDVFGIGGTLSLFSRINSQITIIYLCNGSKGNNFGKKDNNLIKTRKKESLLSGKILNIKNQIFYNNEDGELNLNQIIINNLVQIIKKNDPNIIFTPNIVDNHEDHKATNKLLYETLKKIDVSEQKNIKIAQYEIWTPLYPNKIINITKEIATKNKLVSCHQSQLKSRNYDKAIISLNKYRAEINGLNGYAEAIFLSDCSIYSALYKKLIH